MEEVIKIDPQDGDNKIIVNVEPGKWIIEISPDGFKFNREEYPDALVDDFARAFIQILEMNFDVTMEKRK
jgi:hypothetical protein